MHTATSVSTACDYQSPFRAIFCLHNDDANIEGVSGCLKCVKKKGEMRAKKTRAGRAYVALDRTCNFTMGDRSTLITSCAGCIVVCVEYWPRCNTRTSKTRSAFARSGQVCKFHWNTEFFAEFLHTSLRFIYIIFCTLILFAFL